MSRQRKYGEILSHHEEILQQALIDCQKGNDLRNWKRVKGLLLYSQNVDVHKIMVFLDVGKRTFYDWLNRFLDFGIDGIYESQRPGRPPKLNEEELEILSDIVDSGPVAYGLETGIWTAPMIQCVIEREFGVRYNSSHVRRILHRLGFSVQRPTKKLARADESLQQKWVRETYPELKKKF